MFKNVKDGLAIFIFFTIFFSVDLFADALADLKKGLQNYSAEGLLSAQLTVQQVKEEGEGEDKKISEGSIEVDITDHSKGVSIHYAEDLIQALTKEKNSRNKNPNLTTPMMDTAGHIDLAEINTLVSSHNELLRLLNIAELVTSKSLLYKGETAQLLEFKLSPPLSDKDKKYVKKISATFKLWIDSRAHPLASELDVKVKGRAFLVVGFSWSKLEKIEYHVLGDRLMASRKETIESNKGGGENTKSTVIKSIVVKEQ